MVDEVTGSGLVLESRNHGPQLCLGAVAASYPPQGGGPAITNWDWSAVSGQETAAGTTWGLFTLVGTFTDGALTLTRPPVPGYGPAAEEPEDEPDEFSTPGPVPVGGWPVVDPARTTEESLRQTCRLAERLPGLAAVWLDDSITPTGPDGSVWTDRATRLVLNVAVTGDVDQAEAVLRQTWGGALCVSPAEHSRDELDRICDDVRRAVGAGHLASWVSRDRAWVDVVHDDGSLQQAFDRRYGAGLVVVRSALRPVGG